MSELFRDEGKSAIQYVFVNRLIPGDCWTQNNPESIQRAGFEEVQSALPSIAGSQVQIGVGIVLSYLDSSYETLKASLERVLHFAEETDIPVLIQLEGENWWGARPDLWNWWDPSQSGFNSDNRENVEWTGWTSDKAIKIAWRNWESQFRVLPPPNLMSPRYRKACRKMLCLLVPIVVEWWESLPAHKRNLLVGIKVGHESSIGVNAWYYPNGNDLLDRPPSKDPTCGLSVCNVPNRGVIQLGYAAVKTAGIRCEGRITEADLATVVKKHLEDLSREVAQYGVPRDKLFTHCGGWKDGELLYRAALNEYSCPGWSFYGHAGDPRQDIGVQDVISRMDAPFWGAVEWLYQGPRDVSSWRSALENTLVDPQCRLICIYNWKDIKDSEPVLEAIRQVVADSAANPPTQSHHFRSSC